MKKNSRKKSGNGEKSLRGSGERPSPFRRLVALDHDLEVYYDVRTGHGD